MIELIYGAKGSGKTKKLIDAANRMSKAAKGNVVFLSDKAKYSLDIDSSIRFIVSSEYGITCSNCATAFIKGILACNCDICNVYIDGISRILGVEPPEMEPFMIALEQISEKCKVNFTITVSTDELPRFMKRYI